MVARMMRWRPWPPVEARKVRVRLVVRRAEGVRVEGVVAAEVRWKGPRAALGALRRTVRRNRTRAEAMKGGAEDKSVVEWNEEFDSACTLTAHKEGAFHPWEIAFALFNDMNQGPKSKESVIGLASLNLAEYVVSAEEEIKIDLPLLLPGAASEAPLSLHLTLSILELRTSQETSETVQRCIIPIPLSPTPADALPSEKDELSALKAGLRKVKIITDFVSTRKSKKTCQDDEGSEGRCSARSEDAEYTYTFDTDSLDDDLDEGDVEDHKEDNNIRKSFSYGTLASANFFGGSFCSEMSANGEDKDWVYYSHRRSDVGFSLVEETSSSFPEQSVLQTSKRSILPWKRRKLSFRSPKAKGEPLLKKAYGEEGGDDIDYDRRQLSSSDESLSAGSHKVDNESSANHSSVSDFGDDNFAVGCWEAKEVVSRDGHMMLCTQVFFASIDQRSERAAGESACTALVAVIADWFHKNPGMMPIKSQFDSLIREGSLEWRNLCKNQTYRERFPDRHFDLETVVQAKIRPLSVHPGKSFIGFFQPEGTEDISGFDFLHGAMSFDSIWEEISRASSDCLADGNSQLYIVSWNDHFFVLKVEKEAYYILDTLGERLYEGCNQAYILKFDDRTLIRRVQSKDKSASVDAANSGNQQAQQDSSSGGEQDNRNAIAVSDNGASDEEIVCRGKESCKEYIKSFLAAIPIRELQADIKKGLMASTPLHHRLQIDFHVTESSSECIVASFFPSAGAVTGFSWPAEPVAAAAFALTPAASLEMEVA